MKSYTMVSLSIVKVEYWRLHKAGCKDIGKEQGSFATFAAENAKAAVDRWMDAELTDMGYTASDVKVLSCAR